jgi:tetratricopeptide (TPR) repeat protein
MSKERQLKTLFITILSCMAAVAVLVITVDPFYHYHAPAVRSSVYLYSSFYQSPGMARHFAYDAAIVGTSMTENTHASWLSEEGYRPVKLSYSGGRLADDAMLLDQIYKSGNDVRLIIMDINEYQLSMPYDSRISTDPDYLTDNNLFNDMNYLFNKDVLLSAIGRLLAKGEGIEGNEEDAYTWEDDELFGHKKVIEDYDMVMEGVDRAFAAVHTDEEIEEKIINVRNNIDNIGVYIKAHPETEYKVFFPPYSMGYWESLREEGDLDETIVLYKEALKSLSEYDNVSVYFFMDNYDVITDLDYYRDICHYRPEINRMINDMMMKEAGQDTTDIIDRLDNLAEYVRNSNIVDEYRDLD